MLEKYIIDIPDLTNENVVRDILCQLYEIEYSCEQIMLENESLKPDAKKEMPIVHIMIASSGGLATGCVSIIAMVEKLKRMGCFVITECCSHALSAGFFIFLTGDVRLATYPKMSKWLYHCALTSLGVDNVNVLIDTLELIKADMDALKEYVVERTNITMEQLDEYDKKDWWIYYDEAKKLGIIKEEIDESLLGEPVEEMSEDFDLSLILDNLNEEEINELKAILMGHESQETPKKKTKKKKATKKEGDKNKGE